ncbi:DUF6292 family protein [Spirillospora sp. NPDC048911]|uniref:DUF6292 family protein n=1 Tax=Spirillospora sp. NPDC048911 TaxID=3364527 RepID=UPI00371E46C3
MLNFIVPEPHPIAEVDRTRGYITAVSHHLHAADVEVVAVWLDPMNPRDATFVIRDSTRPNSPQGLVWNEWEGWFRGEFGSGRQGERTKLKNSVHLGGGKLPKPEVVAVHYALGTTAPIDVEREAKIARNIDAYLERWPVPALSGC